MIGEGRWTWINLGILVYVTCRVLKYQLNEIRRVTEVYEDEQDNAEPSKQGSEALRIASLKTLTESPNYELQQAAIKVVCERVTKGKGFQLLLYDIGSKNAESRDRALRALQMLIENGVILSSYDSKNGMIVSAIIDGLVHMSSDLENGDPAFQHSSFGYITALTILYSLLPSHITDALDAGLVSRWLRFYPFGKSMAERQAVVKRLILEKSPQIPISEILCIAIRDRAGRKQMVQYGLLHPRLARAIDPATRDTRINSQIGETFVELPLNERVPRAQNETNEQQRLRRRRREAMVLSDGEHPLESNDIIQRTDELTEESMEGGARALLEIAQSQSEDDRLDDDVPLDDRLRII